MSRRTAEASKAIRQAWHNEQERVLIGKGTRDWTPQQQQDIIDKGKAYDTDGKAFIGHHMKSAEAYPEFQGDPEIIQFLSYEEHKAAHGGWRNPTNGYYDHITGETIIFTEEGYIPCEVIDLSHPIITINVNAEKADTKPEGKAEKTENVASPPIEGTSKTTYPKTESIKATPPNSATTKPKKPEGKTGILSRFCAWCKKHPNIVKSAVEIASDAFFTAIVTTYAEENRNGTNSDSRSGLGSHSDQVTHGSTEHKSITPPEQKPPVEDAIRSSPLEHEVSKHLQRYHTKGGVVWREKDSYHRGGKK